MSNNINGRNNMKRTESSKICKTCFGFGMWPDGTAGMGPLDASDGMPTIECPECKANANPIKGDKVIRKWESRLPICCEVCDDPLGEYFIDGAVNGGKWALMCEKCHKQHGSGLGIGKAQKYFTATGEGVEGFDGFED